MAPRVARRAAIRYGAVYGVCLVAFTAVVCRFADRHTGFSPLIQFGERYAARRLPELSTVPLYTYDFDGYDGQFYAQVAVAKSPFNPPLAWALDAPAYRARRILVPLLAHVIGLGRPALVVQVYALLGLVSLWILAALLARWWFPPGDFDNLLRWAGTLFGAGMVMGVTRSLVDGPALLLVAVGVRAVERARVGRAVAWFALAGLARETSLLAAAAFWPPAAFTRSGWRRAALATVACAAPTIVWVAVLARSGRPWGGVRNLGAPFVALASKLGDIGAQVGARGADAPVLGEVLAVLSTLVQVAYVIGRPRPAQVWWRVAAPFAVLSLCLGVPVWEGFPSAGARAALPLALAFNRLVPRTRRGLALLIAGNLSMLAAGAIIESAIPSEQTRFVDGVRLIYGSGWYEPEHRGRQVWRWASGPASFTLRNPNRDTKLAEVTATARAISGRTVTIQTASAGTVWQGYLPANQQSAIRIGPLSLAPGETTFTVTSDTAPVVEPAASHRPLAVSIRDLYVDPRTEPKPD